MKVAFSKATTTQHRGKLYSRRLEIICKREARLTRLARLARLVGLAGLAGLA